MQRTITERDKGKRLDQLTLGILTSLSRAYVQKLIDEQKVLVNNKLSKPGYRLRIGDKVHINFDLKELEQIESIDLPIIFEDQNVIVIDKPAGVISHARGRFWNEPSVASFVREKTNQSGERAGIVHRLDRATSGVMVCAKNSETLTWLQRQFSQRLVKKTYMAIIKGSLSPEKAMIDMPIERNPKRPQTFRVGAQGRPATTAYEILKQSDKYSLLRLNPLTGRTHQLRVHLKQLGHPILGDTFYGGEAADRLYLHAISLDVLLPGNQLKTFEAPMPTNFQKLMDK